MVKAGDKIPDVDLDESSPGDKVNLSKELTGKGLIIGVPAAFSPSCSANHIPGYTKADLTKAGKVFVVSVNDAFVMKAWGLTLDPTGKSGIRFLGDPAGKFTKELDLTLDAAAIFGNARGKRYALVCDNGEIKSVHVEAQPSDVDVSSAEKILANL